MAKKKKVTPKVAGTFDPAAFRKAEEALPKIPTTPTKIAAEESGLIGAASIASRMPPTIITPTAQSDEQDRISVTGIVDTLKPTGAQRAAGTIAQRKQAFEEELARREASKPTEDPGAGYAWIYSVAEGRWKKVFVGNGFSGSSSSTSSSGSSSSGSSDNATSGDGDTITTNVDILKSMLRGLGFNSSIIDSSTSFLMALLKDGLEYDNAIAVFLNSKDYTFKDGKKLESPFYTEYGYLNEGLVRRKSAAELYNAVEGYKEVASTYNLNQKFLSKDYLKNYIKNNVSVANLAERANLARLKSVNADPAYTESLRKFGYITTATDLTDFFLDPTIGQETMNQRRSEAAFGAEAIKRAQQGVEFSTDRFNKIVSGLLGLGMSAEGVEVRAAQGFQNISESLLPTGKLSGIYERLPQADQKDLMSQIQSELEKEEFTGLASERRKRLRELETRSFQAQAGTAGSLSLRRSATGAI